MTSRPLHVIAALDGAGWHPQAWRDAEARPAELQSARYWTDVVREAEAGLLDAVTIEDGFSLQSSSPFVPDDRTDQVRGRLDAVLLASRLAPVTTSIGLLPTAIATHTEPFHLSKAIATLDHVSQGRGGVRVQVSGRPSDAAHVGRRTFPTGQWGRFDDPATQQLLTDLFDEATDYIEVLRRLWDSWEDDAEIRDAATGRFIDVDKLHYIDFEGRFFSVRGPSITPRPPQGQPLVAVLAHRDIPYRLAASSGDLAFVTPTDAASVRVILDEIATYSSGRTDPLRVLGDVVVAIDESAAEAQDRLGRYDELDGQPYTSDARLVAGTASQVADVVQEWHEAGLDGVRLRPAAVPHDLVGITRGLVPELQRRGLFRTTYEEGTLRARFGLARPANRYANV